jgi:hypothetical protein
MSNMSKNTLCTYSLPPFSYFFFFFRFHYNKNARKLNSYKTLLQGFPKIEQKILNQFSDRNNYEITSSKFNWVSAFIHQ